MTAAPWAASERSRSTAAAGRGPAGPAGRRPQSPTRWPRPRPADPGRLTAGFARLFLEVEAGLRPRNHLRPFLDPMLQARLEDVWVRPGPVGQVVRVHGIAASADRFDAVVLVQRGERYGAIGVRLARIGRAWLVVDLARPEDGCLPEPAYPVPPPEDEEDPRAGRNMAPHGELLLGDLT